MTDSPLDHLERDALIQTTRKLMVEAQALSTRIAVLNEIATAINETLELKGILQSVRKKAKWLLDFTYFSVVVKSGGQWQVEHLIGEPLEKAESILTSAHPIGQALQTGRPYRGGLVGFNSFLVVPIQLGNQTIGSLNFGCLETTYDQDDVRIAYMLSQQLAAAFRNAMQFDELNRTLDELNQEQKVSEALLQNILPQAVAKELKVSGEVKPVHYDMATVMFIDFLNFTSIASQTSPTDLVNQLNWYFTRFDAICIQQGVEKLKTIGDAYMCVSGVPDEAPDHAQKMLKTAQAILGILKQDDAPGWQARIGLHSGELVAGVIGKHKFSFDVWGNTVNIAARIESYGDEGKVNLSAVTYELVKDQVLCHQSKFIEIPNLGQIQLYTIG